LEPKSIELLDGIISSGVEVCLISKYWDDETLMKFYNLGYRKFGENRVEALEKRSQKCTLCFYSLSLFFHTYIKFFNSNHNSWIMYFTLWLENTFLF